MSQENGQITRQERGMNPSLEEEEGGGSCVVIVIIINNKFFFFDGGGGGGREDTFSKELGLEGGTWMGSGDRTPRGVAFLLPFFFTLPSNATKKKY